MSGRSSLPAFGQIFIHPSGHSPPRRSRAARTAPTSAATGVRPELPARLADLLERPERSTPVGVDLDQVRASVESLGRE